MKRSYTGALMACPECNTTNMVGRFRTVVQFVYQETGAIVDEGDPVWSNEYECGRCGAEWISGAERGGAA